MTTTAPRTVSTERTHDDPTVGFRRVLAALALPLAFVFQLCCNTLYAVVSTESGLSDTGAPAETMEFYGRYPAQFLTMTILAMVGVLIMVPGLLAALRVLRPYRPRLSLWAVVLMVAGYICYFGIVTTNFTTIALASVDLPPSVAAAAAESSPAVVPFFVLFAVGNIIGTALLGAAVLLSRGLPRWAGALILGWPVGHIINVFLGGGEWFAVAGGILEIAGLVVIAGVALRTSNEQWRQRG